MTTDTTAAILTVITEHPAVSQVKAWRDRHYVTLAAAYRSRANADLHSKLWVAGTTLTYEAGTGDTAGSGLRWYRA